MSRLRPEIPDTYIITLDTARFITDVMRHNDKTSLNSLRGDLIDQKIRNTSYWKELNISPFLRYSYYMRPEIRNSSNIDAGISFIVPLSAETASRRSVLEKERALLEFENISIVERLREDVKLKVSDLDRMNRSIAGEYERLVDLRKYLRLRSEAYANRIGEYNYLSRMKEYNTYLLCIEKLLLFSYQRDCLIASMQSFLPDVSILDYCDSRMPGEDVDRDRHLQNSLSKTIPSS